MPSPETDASQERAPCTNLRTDGPRMLEGAPGSRPLLALTWESLLPNPKGGDFARASVCEGPPARGLGNPSLSGCRETGS